MTVTLRRITWIFSGIGLASLVLAAAGRFALHWPDGVVGALAGIGGGYLLGALAMLLSPRWWRQHCDEMYAQPAGRRYVRRLFPILLAYVLGLSASLAWIRHGIHSLPLRAVVAAAPALAIVALMWAALRYLREIDELQRRIETEAIGMAALGVSVLYFAGGLLEKAKVLDFEAGAAMIWVFPLLMALYGIGKMVLTRRYL